MIVELEAAAFQQDASLVDLVALISLCRGDPHSLLLDPPHDEATSQILLAGFGDLKEEVALTRATPRRSSPRSAPK